MPKETHVAKVLPLVNTGKLTKVVFSKTNLKEEVGLFTLIN